MIGPRELFPDEVVTRALVRYIDIPGVTGDTTMPTGVGGEVALITLDNGRDHTRPSTFGPAGLAALSAAMDEIEARTPGVTAIAVTGKPYVFAVGADISAVGRIAAREDAVAIAREGHRVFGRLRAASVPTFALINGACLGGGLELALACDFRTLSAGAGAIAFPECFLGLIPGWGGCYLLPNLIGAAPAIKVIIDNPLSQNRMLLPAQACDLGIADVMLEPADFLERSLAWAGGVLRGETDVRRAPVDRDEAWDAAVAAGRAGVDARLHGAAPAPYRALDLIAAARTATAEDACAAEDEALADLLMSEELRSGLYAFDLVRKRARRPVGAPDPSLARPISKVGVIGAGLMARQLALLLARRLKVPVVLTDVDQRRIDAGVEAVRAEIAGLAGKRRVGPDLGARLAASVTGSLDYHAFADADLVIEAAFEDLGVKRQILADVEAVAPQSCVLATNTSSLSVA
ncbi:MAG: 3-hydroxyacyl-CoA dehydrogenase NAD-binding domain-containing protein, partial [Mycobacteriales bacterium]